MPRDPFRPQDPWKAEWDQHTQRHHTRHTPGPRNLALLLLVWGAAIGLVVVLSFFVSVRTTGIVAAVVFLLLLLTVRV